MIGQVLGERYQIVEEVGRGGMGVVFRARDVQSSADVAIKVLPRDLGADPLQAGRFARECGALERLSHPNVVAFHQVGDVDGQPYLAMEFVSGRPMSAVVAESREPVRESLRLALQIAGALEHAHDLGIVHRDLKPGNILVTADGTVKVMDFGLARRVHDETRNLTATGGLVGTFAYLPPEQALGRRVDTRADMYALGVLLYELMTGVLPFTAPDPVSVIFHHISTPPDPPSVHNATIPPDVDAFVLRLMAKDPADRFERMADVIAALEPLLAADAGAAGGGARAASRVPPFCGVARARIRNRLVGALQDAAEGRGSAWRVVGPPECGKTRLVQELRSYAHFARCRFVEATAWPAPPAGAAIAHAVAGFVQDLPPLERRALLEAHREIAAHLLPELVAEVEEAAITPTAAPPSAENLARQAAALLAAIAEKFPCVLFVDDAHALDEASAAVLAVLAEGVGSLAFMLVLTVDEEYRPLPPMPAARPVRLPALTDDEIDAITSFLWPAADETALRTVRERAGGAPGPAALLAHAASLAGSAPDTLRAAAEAVVDGALADGLDPTLLAAAAELDEMVSAERLHAILGCPSARAEDLVRRAAAHGLLRPTWYLGRSCFRFASRRLRQALRDRAAPRDSQAWHAHAARVARGPAEAALHLEAAHRTPEAARAWVQAAHERMGMGARREARRFLEHALAHFEGCGMAATAEGVEALCALGDLTAKDGSVDEAVSTYRDAADRAAGLAESDSTHLSRALESLTEVLRSSGQTEEAIRVLSAHLHGPASGTVSGEARARLQFSLALTYRHALRTTEAMEHLDRARGEIRRLRESGLDSVSLRRLEAECQQALAEVYGDRGDWERALSARLESLQGWRDVGDASRVLDAYAALADLAVTVRADFARAARYHEKALEFADGAACPPGRKAPFLRGLAECCRRQGQWESVRPLLESAVEDARRADNPRLLAGYLEDLARVACLQGATDAEPLFLAAAEAARQGRDATREVAASLGRARFQLAEGDPQAALETLKPIRALPADLAPRGVRYVTAEALLRLGCDGEAATEAEPLQDGEDGMALRIQGLLAAARGDARAAERLELAVAAFSGEGDEWESAVALFDLAVLELRKEGLPVLPGLVPDPDRPFRLDAAGSRAGVSRLEQSARHFATLGAARERARAQSLLRAVVSAASERV